MTDQFYTSDEVATMLRVPLETVRTWRKVGRGPKAFKIPGARRVLYAAADLEAFIAEARGGAA